MSVLSRLTGATAEALELGRAVVPLWQALGDRLWEGATRNEVGLDLWLLGRLPEARAAFAEAAALQRAIGDRYGEAVARTNLCAIDLPRGELRAAVACYERALPLLAAVRARSLAAAALTSAGRAWDLLGEPDEALRRYGEALAHQRATGDRLGEARTLNNLAVLQRDAGETREALASYGQALAIFRDLEDRRWQARVLHNLGAVYQGLGEPRQALACYEQALALWRAAGDREGEAATLTHLGLAAGARGEPRAALGFYEQALALERALGDRRGEGVTLAHLARAHAALGDPAAALPLFEQVLERLRAVGDVAAEADTLRGLGQVQGAMERPEDAVGTLTLALELARAARLPAVEAQALVDLARAEHARGRTAEALAHAAAALDLLDSLRARIGGPDLRAAFSALRHGASELHVELLMAAHWADPAAGFDRAALEAGERARARTLLELLAEAGVTPAGADPMLLDRRSALERRLSAKAARALVERDAAVRAALEAEQGEILRELDLVDAALAERSPGGDAVSAQSSARPETLSAAEIQGLLDPETLLLSYSLGEERSFLWAVGPSSLDSFELPGRAELETAARRVHEQLAGHDVEARAAEWREAAALSRLLLGPVADRLDGQRLVIVADGALHYLPFAALPLPATEDPVDAAAPVVLIERHEVVSLPSASVLGLQRRALTGRPPAARRLAVLADPLFDPRDLQVASDTLQVASDIPQVARVERSGFESLPAARQEAAAIAALASPGEAWLALDAEASRPAVLGDRLSVYRTIHFATHGTIDAAHPALSGLALATVDETGRPREGFLHLRDVYAMRLNADLVVLSGCRTALGTELRGEGLVGLTRGFLSAGARRVVASLWRMEDRATAELMTRFYRAMWVEGLPPAAALRAAQLSIRRERRWRDPAFWAGFVLQGDWN